MLAESVDVYIWGYALRVYSPLEQREALHVAAEDLIKKLTDLKTRTKMTNTDQLLFSTVWNLCYALAQEALQQKNDQECMSQRIKILYVTAEKSLCNVKTVLAH
ncbi:Cell division protein ZapA [Candidatus Erwinia haradaeae]|uniref:Cell division protein ZapA n=1 Tax=Candidatus Erwinia haradaeae TaxID=1922217 RepID=A0A451DLR0_9GAMM|nr:cell division protein ZapA [Candidatus Erwinia haradaeae]VFP87709.1 Cell division protein ZapA [Candidatus Erwinia haradaeae]